ncbi:MAG: glycosyltransferase family 2 protein [Chloroflexi bacterium]|nr:glycosyltransferase family 2 protein [Chloroflexota bacterium]
MELVFILLQLPLALMVLYLDVLSVAAALGSRAPRPTAPLYRFAFLVPAHNEEMQLPRLLDSTSALTFPRDLYDVHVVADNCTDRTAQVAASKGAIVHERHDEQLTGKGYALQWLLDRVRQVAMSYDAYIVVDADSVVSPNFLAVMNDHLARGDQVVQGYDGVLNRAESWVSGLSYIALALFNNLRPRGRDALGLSVGLRGNGMCFASAIIERFGWEVCSLTEDHAFHMQLVSAGIRVRYAPEASVLAEQPTSLQQAYTQSVRWERGRFQNLPVHVLAAAVRRRSPAPLDALAEQFVPPLSVLTGAVTLMLLLALWLHLVGPLLLAAMLVLGVIGYVVTGLLLVGAGWSVYRALLSAPFYVVWKLWIVAVAAAYRHDSRWIRTARAEEDV